MSNQVNGLSTSEEKGYTPVESLQAIHDRLNKTFYSGKTKDVKWRKEQLKNLAYMIQDNTEELTAAIHADLGRSKNETYIVELLGILNEVIAAVDSVESWSKPTKPSVAFDKKMLKPTIYKEPKGVALIIGTWNYAVTLSLSPLCGVIAAGCPAILKCSEVTSHTGAILAKLIPQYLDQDAYAVVLGEVDVITKLLEMQWAHIFYTGNSKVARIIAAAAAKHLTPITLELGGKSPAIIDPNLTDMTVPAKRILWGKRINCGQTCIAPDYIIVTQDKHAALLEAIEVEYKRVFPSQDLSKDDYPRIASINHFDRLKKMIDNSNGKVIHKGQMDRENRLMGITVIDDVSWDDAVMKEEIFGPVLPIMVVPSIDATLSHLQGTTPLALYCFSQSQQFISKVRTHTQSGAFIVNDVLIHFTVDELPFGGIGESGMGSYHGKKSFDTFTHERSSLTAPFWADFLLAIRYYPYTDKNNSFFRTLQAKKINFNRPESASRAIKAKGETDTKINTGTIKTLAKYATIALLCAVATKNLSWLIPFISKYKLVKVD